MGELKIKYRICLKVIFILILLIISTVFASGVMIKSYHKTELNYDLHKKDEVSKWTVIYYMCCDSNMMGLGNPLLENLTKIGSNDDFNLIALYDGVPPNDSKIIYFSEDNKRINLNNILGWPSEVDYSNPVTLEEFVKDIITYYPAENYAVFFYGSAGTGWMKFCVHDTQGTFENLIQKGSIGFSTTRLGEVFKEITNSTGEKVDIIYTSCAMNTIEMAWEVSSYVDYCVGTQDCLSEKMVYRYYEPAKGLSNNSNMTPEDFSKYCSDILDPICFYYHDEWLGGIKPLNKIFNKLSFKKLQSVKHCDNIGVVNNSNLNDLLKSLDDLSRYLIVNIKDEKIFEDIAKARAFSRESSKCYSKPGSILMYLLHRRYAFNFTAYSGVIDLGDFCKELKEFTDNVFLKNYCTEVLNEIKKTVPYLKKVENDELSGLNIYFPDDKDIYNKYVSYKNIPCKYEELTFSKDTCWDEFVKSYLGIL